MDTLQALVIFISAGAVYTIYYKIAGSILKTKYGLKKGTTTITRSIKNPAVKYYN